MTETQSRILVADDERNIRKTLSLVLEGAGYEVDVAADGDEARNLCRERHPDIAFVDLRMPKMQGLEVLSHIRAISPKTAVVIITAYGTASNAVEAMKLGAVDFIQKPFDPKIIEVLAQEILFRQSLTSIGSFGDYLHLAELARERNARIEARAYLKTAMIRDVSRPEPYYWLGFMAEGDGDKRTALQYYYMAVDANNYFEPAREALKRLGRLPSETKE
jgi:DNA-binding NtrC family response regulator